MKKNKNISGYLAVSIVYIGDLDYQGTIWQSKLVKSEMDE